MEKDELRNIVKIKYPKVECDPNKAYEYFLKSRRSQKRIAFRNITIILYTLIICFITSLTTFFIQKKITENNINQMEKVNIDKLQGSNTDMGKDPYIAVQGVDPDQHPIIDQIIAFGPEKADGTFDLSVILRSNLINEEDKQELKNYETEIKKTYPSHNVRFQIALGIKDGKDIIYLIDGCGYDIELEKTVNSVFIFNSNLSYSFDTLVNDFEELTGKELTNDFLNKSHYDDQHLQEYGIILAFIEKDEQYQEYYILKLEGNVFILNR